MVDYSDRLNEGMRLAKKSKQNLADHLGISYQAVKKAIDGKTSALNAENSARAARYLGVDSHWLATGEGEPTPRDAWPFETFGPEDYYRLDAKLRLEMEDRLLGAITRNKQTSPKAA